MMRASLQMLTRHGAPVLAIGVFAGLAMPSVAAWCRPLLPAAVAGLLYLALLRIEWLELGQHVSRPLPNVVTGIWLLLLAPLLVWSVTIALGVESGLAAALVLMAACPPIMSGPAMALMLGLDAPLMLVLVVFATLTAPFTLLLISASLIGLEIDVSPYGLFLRLALLIGGCFAAALITRRLVGRARLERWRDWLDGASLLLLLVFAVAIMHGVMQLAVVDPWHVLWFVLVAFVANLLLQIPGIALARARGPRAALTVGFASGNRNMGLLLAVLPVGPLPDTLLFFALAQFPIYILPAALKPVYRKWIGTT